MKGLFLLGILPLWLSCTAVFPGESPDLPVQERISDGRGSYALHYHEKKYPFTDKIPVLLSLEGITGSLDRQGLPGEGEAWGEFTVLSRTVHPEDRILWHLVPDNTGEVLLPGLELLIREGGESRRIQFQDRVFAIESSLLNESGRPEELMWPDSERDNTGARRFFFLLLLPLGGIVFLFLRIRRRKRQPADGTGDPLISVLEQLQALEEDEEFLAGPGKEQYREVYRLTYTFLHSLAAQFSVGLAPLALRDLLEEPSSFNQWTLRALYPFLERAEDLFYNPAAPQPEAEMLSRDITTILECFQFLRDEAGPAYD